MSIIAEGYPDWQRVSTRAFNPFYRQTFDTGGVQVSTGLLYVANFPAMIVSASASGTSTYNMTVQWYTDQDKVNALLVEQIGVAGPGWGYRVAHGIVSPWVDLFVIPTAYTPADTYSLALVPSTFQIPQIQLSYNYLIRQTAASIAAGVTTTYNANAVIPGPGKLYFHTSNATSYSVNLQILESDGAWHSSFFYESTTMPDIQNYDVTLPPRPCRVAIHNRGAAAASFDMTLSSWAQ